MPLTSCHLAIAVLRRHDAFELKRQSRLTCSHRVYRLAIDVNRRGAIALMPLSSLRSAADISPIQDVCRWWPWRTHTGLHWNAWHLRVAAGKGPI